MTATPTPLRELAGLLSRACELLARCEIDLKWLAMHAESEIAKEAPELLGDIVRFQHDSENAALAILSARDAAGAVPYTELPAKMAYDIDPDTGADRGSCCGHAYADGWNDCIEAVRRVPATPPASGEAGAEHSCPSCSGIAPETCMFATPPAASGELTEADKHALNTFATMAWGSAQGGYEAAQAAYRHFRSRLAAVAPAGMTVKDRDALWCEAIVNTQKWSAEFRALACDTVELLRYFNAHRPDDTPPATAGKE